MKGFIKGDQIKGDEKIGSCNTHGVDEKLMKKILVGKPILMRQLWLQWRVWADNIIYLWYSNAISSTTDYMASYDTTIRKQ
jgi:hypothetical protein